MLLLLGIKCTLAWPVAVRGGVWYPAPPPAVALSWGQSSSLSRAQRSHPDGQCQGLSCPGPARFLPRMFQKTPCHLYQESDIFSQYSGPEGTPLILGLGHGI